MTYHKLLGAQLAGQRYGVKLAVELLGDNEDYLQFMEGAFGDADPDAEAYDRAMRNFADADLASKSEYNAAGRRSLGVPAALLGSAVGAVAPARGGLRQRAGGAVVGGLLAGGVGTALGHSVGSQNFGNDQRFQQEGRDYVGADAEGQRSQMLAEHNKLKNLV